MNETMRKFVRGLIVGMVSRGVMPEKVPIAYLYNGVQLPALPEWDKETYPYAFICYASGSYYENWTYAYYSDQPLCYDGTNLWFYQPLTDYTVWYSHYDATTEEWGDWTEITRRQPNLNFPHWTNHDVINTDDGTVAWTTSEPVPVYE